jgi:hypothetical protein
MYKYPADRQTDDESSIPLLPKMGGDKLKADSSGATDVSRDYEESSTNSIIEQRKAPWWSYIWVG